jgi:hypothetical protein
LSGASISGGCGCSSHVGCSTGVCYGYDNCCPRLCPGLACCLKKVVRMLDCLLPCGKCCHSGGLLGHGCMPHLFHRGRCGGMSCSTGCPSCSTPAGHPQLSDPFQDDPVLPTPMPEPAKDVRRGRVHDSPYAWRTNSPYKVTTARELARKPVIPSASHRPITPPSTRDKVATHSGGVALPIERPALRQASLDEVVTPARAQPEAASTPPALLPVTIQRTSAEAVISDADIPVNPLRK